MNGAIGVKRATHCGRFGFELSLEKMENNETNELFFGVNENGKMPY